MADIIPIRPPQADPNAPDPDVLDQLMLKDDGEPRPSKVNIQRILTLDPKWKGRIAFDTFLRCIVLDGEQLTNHDVTSIVMDIGLRYGFEPPDGRVWAVLGYIGHGNQTNSLRGWLDGLVWDRQPRISSWLTKTYGVEDDEIHEAFARRFLISAVARAYQPGCKVDTVLVLCGGQGTKKSSVFQLLAGEDRFCNTSFKVGGKDAFMQMSKAWIYEVAEMSSFSASRASDVKAFISSAVDTYRPPYGRHVEKLPRHTVFVATENNDRPLNDPTGSRRFWPVAVSGQLDEQWVKDNRDQLWAEAVAAYKAGEQWWLTDEEENLRKIHNHQFEEIDPWTGDVETWASQQDGPFTLRQCIEVALGVPGPKQDRGHENRVGAILRRVGYSKRKARRGELADGTRPWLWEKPEG